MRTQEKSVNQSIIMAIEFIYANYYHKFPLKEIADHIGLSRQHFCRLFKKSIDITLTGYINNLRLERSIELMKEDESRLKCIADSVGLSPKYFWKLFKDKYGVSPSQYREKIKKS